MEKEIDEREDGGQPILEDDGCCGRMEEAGRAAFLVDAAAYFAAFKRAALKAERSILIIGWDVNSKTPLEYPSRAMAEVPNELGPFLDFLVARRPELEIRVLDWDSPLIYAPDRELLPQVKFDWFTHDRLRFALDSSHPVGGSQHQKIVVIDDAVAFNGGLDLTAGRLDDRDHAPDNPERRDPGGNRYGPYHDVMLAVDGAAARHLGDIARERWRRATGEEPPPAVTGTASDPWPDDLAPVLRDTSVMISRTLPQWREQPEVREIEALYLRALPAARWAIYIENQYFTSEAVAKVLTELLRDPKGPEIVMVLPDEPTKWLEKAAMGIRQRDLLYILRRADEHGRLAVYVPFTGEDGKTAVKVHSKVMTIDERFVTVGSANLNNRSMGYDSECNLSIEALEDAEKAEVIAGFRDSLLAEHLGVTSEQFSRALAEEGSLVAAVEAVRGEGRSLYPFPESEPESLDAIARKIDMLDPKAPIEPERLADDFVASEKEQMTLRQATVRLALLLAALAGLAALWRWGPLAEATDPQVLAALSDSLRSDWLGVLAGLAVFFVGGITMFPVTALIAATGIVYGPVMSIVVAALGSLSSAVAGYGIGAWLGRRSLQRLSGERLAKISRQLAKRGVLSVIIVRVLPVAPFTLINLAAGASRIRLRDFVIGTVLGMGPGIVAITLFSSQLVALVREPDLANLLLLGVVTALMLATAWWMRKRFSRPA